LTVKRHTQKLKIAHRSILNLASGGNMTNVFVDALTGHETWELALSVTITFALGIFAYFKSVLDLKGSVLSTIVGLTISLFTNAFWLITLILFLIFTYAVTILKYEYKKSLGIGEGRRGERGARNVVANGLSPAFIAFCSPILGDPLAPILFLTAISVAASDTFASELGVFSQNPRMITTFKKARVGTDGAISPLGELSCVIGAFIPAMIGWLLLGMLDTGELYLLWLPFVVGVAGCHLDSLLGATVQKAGKLSNDDVNFVSIYIGVVIAWLISIWFIL